MRIGLVAVYFYPDLAGGAEQYTWHMCRELVKLGHEVHVYTQKTEKAPKEYEVVEGVHIHRVRALGWYYRLKWWPGLVSEIQKQVLDTLVILDYAQTFSWQGLRYGRSLGIPVHIMINDIQSLKPGRQGFKHACLSLFDRFFAGQVLKKATLLLVRTNWTRDHLLAKYPQLDGKKIHITPSGLAPEDFVPGDPERFRETFNIRGPIVMYFGRIRRQKGIHTLLRAYQLVKQDVPDAQLVYVGPDDKEYDGLEHLPQLKAEAQGRVLKDIHFTGPLYGQDKNDALAACTVMALPSTFENFGQAYTHALAQARPIIGTNGGGIPEIIEHKKDGFITEANDVTRLADYITILLQKPELARLMGERGRQKVRQYLYPTLAKELEQLLVDNAPKV